MRVLIAFLLGASLGGCALSAGYSVTKFEYREPPDKVVVHDDEDRPARPYATRHGGGRDDGR